MADYRDQDDRETKSTPDINITFMELKLRYETKFDWHWFGWRRILWFSLAIDFTGRPWFGIVFLGFMFSYGKRPVLSTTEPTGIFTKVGESYE